MIERKKKGFIFQYERVAPPKNVDSQGPAQYGKWNFRVVGLFEEWRPVKNLMILKSLDSAI